MNKDEMYQEFLKLAQKDPELAEKLAADTLTADDLRRDFINSPGYPVPHRVFKQGDSKALKYLNKNLNNYESANKAYVSYLAAKYPEHLPAIQNDIDSTMNKPFDIASPAFVEGVHKHRRGIDTIMGVGNGLSGAVLGSIWGAESSGLKGGITSGVAGAAIGTGLGLALGELKNHTRDSKVHAFLSGINAEAAARGKSITNNTEKLILQSQEKTADTTPIGMVNAGNGNFTDLTDFVTSGNNAAMQAGLIGGAALGGAGALGYASHARKARIEKFLAGKTKGLAIKFASEDESLEKEAAGKVQEAWNAVTNFAKAPSFNKNFETAGFGPAYEHFKDIQSGAVKSDIGIKATTSNMDKELGNVGIRKGTPNYDAAKDAMNTKYNVVDPMVEQGFVNYTKGRMAGINQNAADMNTMRARAKVSDGYNPAPIGNMTPVERAVTAPLRHPYVTTGAVGATLGGAYLLKKQNDTNQYNTMTY